MKRMILFASIFSTLITSPFVRAESPAPLTDQYIESIRVGCSDALRGILQVEKTEAATRVNRGREYESLLKLMTAFNSRVVLNNRDAPILTSTTVKVQSKFAAFQKDYLDYARKVDDTLEINCKQAPVSFYDSLTATRDARLKVAADVRDIDALLDEYQKGLDSLKVELTRPVGASQ